MFELFKLVDAADLKIKYYVIRQSGSDIHKPLLLHEHEMKGLVDAYHKMNSNNEKEPAGAGKNSVHSGKRV